MIKLSESRKLLNVSVIHDNVIGCFSMNHQGDNKTFFGTEDEFRLFLKRFKFIDNLKEPRSLRAKTYKQMIDNIIDKTDTNIMVWSNIWNQIQYRTIRTEI
jgi:hypothetical protein